MQPHTVRLLLSLLLLIATHQHCNAAVVMPTTSESSTTESTTSSTKSTATATATVVRLRHNKFHCFEDRPIVEHGYYEVMTEDGHVIKPRCDSGFQLVGGDLRVCNETMQRFMGNEPYCEDINECQLLSNSNASEITELGSGGMDYDDDEDDDDLVACDEEADCFNVIGSYRCICRNGVPGNGFICSEKLDRCPVPEPPTYGVIVPINHHNIRVLCHPDYSIHGHSIVTCAKGQWQHLPKCIPGWKSCGDSGVPENGYRKGNRYNAGSTVRFYCRHGYDLEGSRLRMCLEPELKWTGTQPKCIENDITKEKIQEPALPPSEKILHREKRI